MHGSCFDWVAYHSRRRPDEVAVANADSPFALTWTQLEARVARLAHLLAGTGPVRRGDRDRVDCARHAASRQDAPNGKAIQLCRERFVHLLPGSSNYFRE